MNQLLQTKRAPATLFTISFIILLMICLPVCLDGQQTRMMLFNLETMELDSILLPIPDYSITKQNTNFSPGQENAEFELLKEEYPIENLIPNTQFTQKKQASLDYSISKFPFRTAVKIFAIQNDSL